MAAEPGCRGGQSVTQRPCTAFPGVPSALGFVQGQGPGSPKSVSIGVSAPCWKGSGIWVTHSLALACPSVWQDAGRRTEAPVPHSPGCSRPLCLSLHAMAELGCGQGEPVTGQQCTAVPVPKPPFLRGCWSTPQEPGPGWPRPGPSEGSPAAAGHVLVRPASPQEPGPLSLTVSSPCPHSGQGACVLLSSRRVSGCKFHSRARTQSVSVTSRLPGVSFPWKSPCRSQPVSFLFPPCCTSGVLPRRPPPSPCGEVWCFLFCCGLRGSVSGP